MADFGIARALAAAGGERLTETGLALGTPPYMSPEQAAGDPRVDGRADIYAPRVRALRDARREPPFTGPTAQAIIAKRMLEPVPRIRTVRESVPQELERAIIRALAKTPADRFGTAQEFADALSQPTGSALVSGSSGNGRRLASRGDAGGGSGSGRACPSSLVQAIRSRCQSFSLTHRSHAIHAERVRYRTFPAGDATWCLP